MAPATAVGVKLAVEEPVGAFVVTVGAIGAMVSIVSVVVEAFAETLLVSSTARASS